MIKFVSYSLNKEHTFLHGTKDVVCESQTLHSIYRYLQTNKTEQNQEDLTLVIIAIDFYDLITGVGILQDTLMKIGLRSRTSIV